MMSKFKRLKTKRYHVWTLEFILGILIVWFSIYYVSSVIVPVESGVILKLFMVGPMVYVVCSSYYSYIKDWNQKKGYLSKRAMLKAMEKKIIELPELQMELKQVGIHLKTYENSEYVVRYKEVELFSRYLEESYPHRQYSYSIKNYLSWEMVCWLYFEFAKASEHISVKQKKHTKGKQEEEQRMREELEKEMFGE